MPRPYPDLAKRKNFCGGWDFRKAQDEKRGSHQGHALVIPQVVAASACTAQGF